MAVSAMAAVMPGEVFRANRDAILAGSAVEMDGYVFGVGRAKSPSSAGFDIGTGKARLLAMDRLADWVRDASPWPEGSTKEDRRNAWLLLLEKHPLSLTVEDLETVCTERPADDLFLAVLAVPADAIREECPEKAQLADALKELRTLQVDARRELAAKPEEHPSTEGDPPEERKLPERHEPTGFLQTPVGSQNETMSEDDI